jgi:hypothetical protein
MSAGSVRRSWFIPAVLVLAVGSIILTGCSNKIRRIPVSGTVTLDGKPLDRGIVMFSPDVAKGNMTPVGCSGPISSGRFNLVTTSVTKDNTGAGAPLGWYKITLINDLPGMAEIKVHPRFLRPETSPIEVEIVDNPAPGAYDIKFTTN